MSPSRAVEGQAGNPLLCGKASRNILDPARGNGCQVSVAGNYRYIRKNESMVHIDQRIGNEDVSIFGFVARL